MKTVYVFFANGFEEIEALTVIDVLRRAEIGVSMVSVTGNLNVVGAHNITVSCDTLFEDCLFDDVLMLVLPGGSIALMHHEGLQKLTTQLSAENKYIAAICAAPAALGEWGLLQNRKATCYPGFENYLHGATVVNERVVSDDYFITANGPASAMPFALRIVETLVSQEKADELRQAMGV